MWTTYALTTLLEKLWASQRQALLDGRQVSPYMVELSSVLERALNVAHTGNVRVIATSLMNPLFVGRSLIDHGTPTFHECVLMGQTAYDPVHIQDVQFPRQQALRQPLTASKRSQILNYGVEHWEVCSPFRYTVILCRFFRVCNLRSFHCISMRAALSSARWAYSFKSSHSLIIVFHLPFLTCPFALRLGVPRRAEDEILLRDDTRTPLPQR